MSDKEMDDILGEAIDAVADNTNIKVQNDNDSAKPVQNDTDDVEAGMDIDVLGDLLNESATPDDGDNNAELDEGNEEGSVDLLADLGIDLSGDEPYATEPKLDEESELESEQELDSESDDLDILDGSDVLVGDDDDSIDVDDLIGQAKGEVETEIPEKAEVEPELKTAPKAEVAPEAEVETQDDDDPLTGFGEDDPLDMDFEEDDSLEDDTTKDEDVIEPDFNDATDLGDFESEEIAVIEPEIDDGFMSGDAEDVDSNDDDMIDISAEDDLDSHKDSATNFKPHTEVEDVEDMLTGSVGGMFHSGSSNESEESEESEAVSKLPKEVEADAPEVETNDGLKTDTAKPLESDKEKTDATDDTKGKAFGIKAIVLSVVASSLISLGGEVGFLYAFGDKVMGNFSYVDNATFDKKMELVLADFEEKLADKSDIQATKSDVDDQVNEVAANVSSMLNKYNGEIKLLRESMDVLSQKQGVDKAELEALSTQSITLLTQFVDDVKEAQTKVSEEVYAKVIKTVRQEFSERDNAVKLDTLITEVSKLRESDTKNESRLKTAMNLIGVLESDSDFMNRRLAAVEVGAETQVNLDPVSKTLKKGYTGSDGDNWAYIEVETKDGVKSGSHFKYGTAKNSGSQESSKLPYVLKGVFDTGKSGAPKYQVYVSPRASKNATPMGYSVGQQVPGMGRILNVEPTGGNEKIPYIVTTEVGVLKGEQ
tara:strand:- start:12079 stop:14208 length:2130 start_codon:yes stop_codon:yes gene_type:complete